MTVTSHKGAKDGSVLLLLPLKAAKEGRKAVGPEWSTSALIGLGGAGGGRGPVILLSSHAQVQARALESVVPHCVKVQFYYGAGREKLLKR